MPDDTLAAMEEYYRDFPGCAGRSLHRFSEEVERRFEAARGGFARFLGRSDPSGVVFLRNATEAINLVGQGLSWNAGDRVLLSDREHNSNLIVWQRLAAERGVRLEVLPLPDGGGIDADDLDRRLSEGVRLVSLFHTSNLDGSSLPVREITERAHDRGALVMFDGCQAAPHEKVELDLWGVDFYALSAHKMLGPTGTGVLAAAPGPIALLRPLVLGGETVAWSTTETHALRPPPHRFEAGLQNYAGVLGAHAGLRYLERVGLESVRDQQYAVNARVSQAFTDEPRVHLLGPADPHDRPSIFAFTVDGVDPNDVAVFLDEGHDVMVRSGMHCVHSFYAARDLPGNVRASFYLYNDRSDADRLIAGLRELLEKVPGPSSTG
ncbi:MAG TPA: aminotransferase class V-fold PLP-dependent enzyme, partial [Thermoplasmata archaeon]|nr:aminotransferase class V-fold PLP-dependent enzyme [Thermoplasmata archaeon]